MTDVIFIADFFAEDILGGGELNNEELISILYKRKVKVLKKRSIEITEKFLNENKHCFFIIANFVGLEENIKKYIENLNYIIYEHDHKYVKSRNPAIYNNFLAPPSELVNISFYKNAKAVLCQSIFHKNIIDLNIKKINTISVSGNIWSEEDLSFLEKISLKKKEKITAIMDSSSWHKNTQEAKIYCQVKKYNYILIPSMKYRNFLQSLGNNERLVFFPKTPETLSRIAVEARMMNMSVITNKNLGASYEPWFSTKGTELINIMRGKRKEIADLIEGFINEDNISNK